MNRRPNKNRHRPSSRSEQPRAGQRPKSTHDPIAHFRDQRVVVGTHAVEEVFRVRPNKVTQLWLREGWEDSKQLAAIKDKARNVKFEVKSVGVLDRIASSHQGVCAIVSETPEWSDEHMSQPGPMTVLILDGIEDPQNLGAILRTAWLMNVKAIFVPQDRSASLTPAAHKVASGGAEHVPVEVVTNLARTIEELKKQDFWVYGLAEKGKQTLWQLKLPAKIAWVIGAEDKGLRSTTQDACDELIRIPQIESGSSYNASVAAAIVIAEGVRQGCQAPNL